MSLDAHVCLVSRQASPNLLPLLDDMLKPSEVHLLVTPEMRNRAEFLANTLKPRGFKVHQHALKGMANYDEIQELLLEILGKFSPDRIALNVTGGTKWMAIAAQEIFRMNSSPVFYVNIADDTVLFLGEKQSPHKLSKRIDIETYLGAHGYTVVGENRPQGLNAAYREMCQQLVARIDTWEGAIGQLNNIAGKAATQKRLAFSLAELRQDERNPHLTAVLNELETAGILKSAGRDNFAFVSEDARTFANGGWLEAYVNSLLNELKREGALQDSPRLNIKIRSPSGSENELDIAFIANNQLHIIECKTKRLQGQNAGQSGTEALYKLDSISDLTGLSTNAMLVSYRKLNDADRQRASELNIKVQEGRSIQNLKSALSAWTK